MNYFFKSTPTLSSKQKKWLTETMCIKCGKVIPFVDETRSKKCAKCRKK